MKEIGATEKITEVKKTVNEKTLTMFRLKQSSDGTYPDPASFRSEKQKNIVDFLSGGGSLSFADGEELYGAGRSVFTTLEKNNVIERYTVRIDRDPLTPLCDEKYRNYELSDEQKNVFSAVSELMDSGEAKAALLFGVTGRSLLKPAKNVFPKTGAQSFCCPKSDLLRRHWVYIKPFSATDWQSCIPCFQTVNV